MLSRLVYSRPVRRARKCTLWSAGLSVTVHASIGVAFIVISSRPSTVPETSVAREIVLHAPFEPRSTKAVPRSPFPTVVTDRLPGLTLPEVDAPIGIPPLSGDSIDVGSFARGVPARASGLPSPTGIGIGESGDGAPVAAQLLAEPPVWLSGPAPQYPALLRAARIDGRVRLEFVVDTLGRPERPTLRVIDATHQAFVPEARRAILGSRYRPGRLRGRRVRVLVSQVVEFAVR